MFSEIIIWNNDIETQIYELIDMYPTLPIRVVQSERNWGFGKACNLAVTGTNCDAYLFLNPDTIAINDFITPMRKVLETHLDIGIVGCLLQNSNGRPIQSGECFHSPWNKIKGYIRNSFIGRQNVVPFGFSVVDPIIDVDYVSGANMLISRKNWELVGGFDERFFMYFEEEDLQFRMSKLGLRRCLMTQVRLVHDPGSSFQGASTWKPLFWDSYGKYLKKNYGFSGALLAYAVRLMMFIRDVFKRRNN